MYARGKGVTYEPVPSSFWKPNAMKVVILVELLLSNWNLGYTRTSKVQIVTPSHRSLSHHMYMAGIYHDDLYLLSVIIWNCFSPFHIIIIATCMIRLFGLHNFQLVEGVKHLVEVLFLTNEGTRVWVSDCSLTPTQ